MKVSIGKNTLGGGQKMTTSLNNYRRSTHDLSFVFRTTMAPGVLVPSMKLLMTPGDTFEIKTRCHTLTHPTVGPLFGSFKQQNDFFFCPIRLYQAMLHNNALNIGLDMKSVKLPIVQWDGAEWTTNFIKGSNNTLYNQVHPSSLPAYLGLRSLMNETGSAEVYSWNAVPIIAYFDIFKNYYANKQEENFYTVHGTSSFMRMSNATSVGFVLIELKHTLEGNTWTITNATYNQTQIGVSGGTATEPNYAGLAVNSTQDLSELFLDMEITIAGNTAIYQGSIQNLIDNGVETSGNTILHLIELPGTTPASGMNKPNGRYFYFNSNIVNTENASIIVNNSYGSIGYSANALTDIDQMREEILAAGRTQYTCSQTFITDIFTNDGNNNPACSNPMEGLALKTYQSDINTNWVNTEWIDGDNGINALTAVDTSGGSFTIDQLNLASKVYKMLNRIAVSDGSYNAWIQTVFTAGGLNHIETPLYLGGSSLEIEFQEIISNSATTDEPLGTMAGRGVATNHKGGRVRFKADEPGYIICITSLTPRVDYFQGNEWDMYLQTLDDIHKPALDGIGFQDRLFRHLNASAVQADRQKSIGKQPAWIEYMTNMNKTYGNFALVENEGWMCLNRIFNGIDTYTTYIQPHLYNNIFADTEITAQNFWVQIGFDIEARRVMSAKQIPNL